MRFIDTNIFIRYLTDDDPVKADACEKIFTRMIAKEEVCFTTDMVIAEIVWILESFYELSKQEIQDMVEKILNTPNLSCSNKDLILNALVLYSEKNIDYIDAYNAFIMKDNGTKELYTYDRHFDRVDWLARVEP